MSDLAFGIEAIRPAQDSNRSGREPVSGSSGGLLLSTGTVGFFALQGVGIYEQSSHIKSLST